MTLQNLLAIHRLIVFEARRNDIQRLLGAAERNLADAKVDLISDENRFDAAYKCIMQCAMCALWSARLWWKKACCKQAGSSNSCGNG